ncbi:cobalamin biosynthesis protein CobD [Solidesulfovibrio carbinoliphilus subsp. oakridgensis]|uniref:Cobalamin biosynthesis protein CobD n=1 Tax=Solidesulfovibrio carbinoliphilus subsp. oakridgensis TaxID=694327 RepID=G7Q7I1_9BACT|nr:adenosylcobinamide-phosphate synthase CbiB [Solidesulfovibrio carbinoliphilus]EHJ47134.1 cobalamin biosynthesis protein CobD [Solidesulfovibrio carbinoliphilus subsp. oakridgensis]
MDTTVLLILAVLLDLVFGDPLWLPHPVRWQGAAYAGLDVLADRLGRRTRPFGAACVVAVASTSVGVVWLATRLPAVGGLVGLYFAYAGLALGGLLREGRRAARLLEAGDVAAARPVVAGLVSRDVAAENAAGLWRAVAESVAENANDAFVAPLFWLAVGGPAGLWAYKAVSTADSMWGYRTPRHGRLGWFGARADDVLAFVPARLTALGLWLAARLLRMEAGGTFGAMARDARKSASPNAGWPMAAAAWLCNAGMGGPTVYGGVLVDKPALGPVGRPWNAKRFAALDRLVLVAGIMVAIIMMAVCNLAPFLWPL